MREIHVLCPCYAGVSGDHLRGDVLCVSAVSEHHVAASAFRQGVYHLDDVVNDVVTGAAHHRVAHCGVDLLCVRARRHHLWMDVHQVAPGTDGADGVCPPMQRGDR